MRSTLSVLGASLLFCLATAGTAAAFDPPSGPTFGQTQSSSQDQTGSNSVSQNASSEAISAPGAQVNVNLPISILSDGKNGPVEQSNSSSATSSASNDSTAIHGVDQSQGSEQTQEGSQEAGCCTGGSASFDQGQDSTQSQNASNDVNQNASSKAISAPGAQINVNAPIRIASDGDNSPVTQSNSSSADSSASNTSFAKQGVEQEQSSTQAQDGTQKAACGCKGGGSSPYFGQSQDSDQTQSGSNSVSQNAESKAVSAPGAQINVNAPIRILSDGDNGKVDQSNSSSATSSASNESKAIQFVGQDQASSQTQDGRQSTGSGDNGHEGYRGAKGCGCEHGSGPTFDQTQDSSQSQTGSNSVSQNADSKAISRPGLQANLNAPIRLKSDGSNGPVDQSNSSSATSSASNESKAIHVIGQGQESTQTQDGVQKVGCCDQGKGGHSGPKGKENGCGCGEHGSGPVFDQDQTSNQSQTASNSVTQNADSVAVSKPGKQVNLNAPVDLGGHSCGCEPRKGEHGNYEGGGGYPGGGRGGKGDPVTQSNGSSATSSASNESTAIQLIGQGQESNQAQDGKQVVECCDQGKPGHGKPGGYGKPEEYGKPGEHGPKGKENGCGCESKAAPVFEQGQTSNQSQTGSNSVSQNAYSKAISKPGKQVNLNAPRRLGGHSCGCEPSKHKGKVKGGDRSCGCGHGYGKAKDLGAGPVDQSNTSAADSSASNTSWAAQGVGQSQASGQLQKGLQRL